MPPVLSVLDAPKELQVTDTTETTLALVWKRPVAKIDFFRLVFVSPDGKKTEMEVPGSVNTHTLVNLNPGTVYTITLIAERGRMKSAPAVLSASTGQSAAAVYIIVPYTFCTSPVYLQYWLKLYKINAFGLWNI